MPRRLGRASGNRVQASRNALAVLLGSTPELEDHADHRQNVETAYGEEQAQWERVRPRFSVSWP
jgi:hypothetical protein